MDRLTANCRNGDMRHRRISLGAVPVPLARLDVNDIAHGDLTLFLLYGNYASTGCDHQDLVAVMGMPSSGGPLAEVYHVATVVIRIPIADDRLPRPAYTASGPAWNRR